MSLRIQNNIEAFNAHRQLVNTSSKLSKSMERLSSGYRINRAADDAAGLAISREACAVRSAASPRPSATPRTPSRWCRRPRARCNEVHSMLQRVRELAVQYKNGTLSTDRPAAIQSEVNQLASEIERIGTRPSSTASSC